MIVRFYFVSLEPFLGLKPNNFLVRLILNRKLAEIQHGYGHQRAI